ncbi:MAG: hypothetical protein N3I86_09515 [Verrucomicrobiae bacterium]|nr:hypothetical protein [Verrucomicrobiae bacterium]
MKRYLPLLALVGALGVSSLRAQPVVTVTQGEEWNLAASYEAGDLIQGLIPEVLPGDMGWHPANTDPLDQLPAFTDGIGIRHTGLTGLLNDFPPAGQPAKLIRYALPVPADVQEVRMFTGNNGRDGRVFHTYTVRFSSDGAQTFSGLIYVQSHPSGTLNNAQFNQWRVVLSQLTDASGWLARGVTHIEFRIYAVDNTQGQMRDPFNGVNPFTGLNDGLTAAFVSPLVWEIDVLGQDSPPRLSARRSGDNLELTWRARAPSAVIQTSPRVNPPEWTDLNPQPVIESDGFSRRVNVPIGNEPAFFRILLTP